MRKNVNIELELIITCGIPASGKSTWATDFVKNNKNWVRVNRDDYRYMLKSMGWCSGDVENMITNLVNYTINMSLSTGFNVIVDQTSVKSKYIRDFVKKFNSKANISVKVFDITYEEALERDNNREKKVGEEVLKRMYENYTNLIKTFDFETLMQKK